MKICNIYDSLAQDCANEQDACKRLLCVSCRNKLKARAKTQPLMAHKPSANRAENVLHLGVIMCIVQYVPLPHHNKTYAK